MDCSLFDHIYVINLDSSKDRREHIIQEFDRVGIPQEKYSFFPAVDANSQEVQDILRNGGEQPLPNGMIRKWKHLNKYQIGNWCSYIGVWVDILVKKRGICMICEDDIKFTNYYKPVVDKVFNHSYLIAAGIDLQKPFVIGVGSGWQKSVHKPCKNIQLVQRNPIGQRECNPCHIINMAMARELFVNSVSIVDRASDPYIHNLIGARNQRYWIVPQPIYELSWNPKVQKFRSTIEGPLKPGDKLR